jgi:beta-glucanase (GH16 family)
MRFIINFIVFIFVFIASNNAQKIVSNTQWRLIWSDEFNYKGLPDSTKWGYEVGGYGWGNNELQYYTDRNIENAEVKNGMLNITAKKETKENNQYTSARISTKGKVDFKYGKIEVRAKLPAGKGTWPAIWMLGKNIENTNWPTCGEIDIMEHVGYMKDSIFGTVHSEAYNHIKGTQKGKSIFIADPYTAFHNYTIEWTAEKIDFLMDGIIYNHIENKHLSYKEWPFDQSFYLLLNVAIGGNWGGKFGVDDNICPATMQVDYVRLYKIKTTQ